MQCIIYGLGSGRLRVERYLKNDHKIIGYSDSFYEKPEFNNIKFYKPFELININFDVIIIAVGTLSISYEIEENLINLGICKENIFNFYKSYTRNQNIYDEIISFEEKNYESIILGLSHSFYGISKKYLKYKPLKLCRPSQDLFYNLKKLEKHINIIHQCKNVIIDMYTYTYFNYDVSLSRHAMSFLPENGFEDTYHNFCNNKHYQFNLKEEINNELHKFKNLFNVTDINILKDYIETGVVDKSTLDFVLKDSLSVKNETELCTSFGLSSIQKNIYTDTEKENVLIFEKILSILREENKNINIYLVLIPQYIEVEKRLCIFEKDWKTRFYNILHPLKDKYKFKILDFKNSDKISSNREYYCDGGHLNCDGAAEFTKLLNLHLI